MMTMNSDPIAIAKRSAKRSKGFTLVEVMVALLIVSVAISALLSQMMSNIDGTAYLRDKTIAQWVALNQLELLYLENAQGNKLVGRERSGKVEMANRQWYWRIKPLPSLAAGFEQIAVSVSTAENDDAPVVTIMGLIDQFHCAKAGCG
ncbi:MAG: general secretion pathway protein I [Paraglaciecola psychrophila]|jgi:general secretion pathway protein I